MGNVGVSELLVIFVVTLLLFGAKRIPEIARGLGQGLREFRGALHEVQRELTRDPVPPAPRPPTPSVARDPQPAPPDAYVPD